MEIRQAKKADAQGIARVHVDSWRETYRNILPQELLDSLSYDRRADSWHEGLSNPKSRSQIYVVSHAREDIVGFVAAGPERGDIEGYDGEIYAIYLLARHQGKGWGKALFLTAASGLDEAGYASMALWVLKNNPTRGFYEYMGGRFVAEQTIEIGGDNYLEVAYGWPELDRVGM